MAIVVRYFSTSGAGAADGTTWADRAALFSAGNWSSVITGFAFNGSDSLEARIGPGTYTCSQSLASALFANPPTVANPLTLHGCDSSGNRLAPSNPGWQSAQPVDWDSGLPVIATTTNLQTFNLATLIARHIKLTASGRNGVVAGVTALMDWCIVENSTSSSSAAGIQQGIVQNCSVVMSGTSYDYGLQIGNSTIAKNVRVVGGGSSGNRYGITMNGTSTLPVGVMLTSILNGGAGFASISTNTAQRFNLSKCVFANNGGSGLLLASTASQTSYCEIDACMITGNGGYGIDAQSGARTVATNNRLRDNTSGNFNGFGNYPTDLDNYVTDSDDATDYADSGTYDFRTAKENATLWGKGYGMDEPNTAAAGGVDLPDVMMVGA